MDDMRYAVLSDIHSNLEALDACLASIQKEAVDDTLFLGDAVGYYSQPNEVIERLASRNCWKMVMGNHDAACLDLLPLTAFNPPAADAILWTRNQLDKKSWDFLRSLRMREEIGDITLVHASPFQSERWHYLIQEDELVRNFRYFQGFLCFFGHVHRPFVAEQQPDGSCKMLEGDEWTLDPAKRYLVNAGSVGQPRDGDPRATHLIYDSSTKHLSVRRTSYDNAKAARLTEEAGLPEYLAKRLLSGK
jgi:diadenosine tetraphosphatase ApaH/serine/threonine PP2A family protein phosphatase